MLSFIAAYQYFFVEGKVNGVYQPFVSSTVWMNFTDSLHIDMGILLDPISIMMLIVITVISSMVHIYSRGYMKGDPGLHEVIFIFILVFFFDDGLVLATNLFQMYIFWELVGVSSFLLIGYYYDKASAVSASKKAFIVTRFADFGFLVGILLLSVLYGYIRFRIAHRLEGALLLQSGVMGFMGLSAVTWALALIFIGGAGKSAMFPLHIWFRMRWKAQLRFQP